MRKILLLSLGFLPGAVFAQKSASQTLKAPANQKAVVVTPAERFAKDTNPSASKSSKGVSAKAASSVGTQIGNTYYDLQSNAAVQRRVNRYSNGKTSATWTIAPVGDINDANFAHRGTGYNHFNGTSWNAIPTAKQEATIRTGWPALVVNKNNQEVIINHTNVSGTTYANHKLVNTTPGSTTWTENNITSNATDIWVRTAAASDASHDNVYMIDASQDTTYIKSGAPTRQPVLYSRSTDGGATWTTDHVLIPNFPYNRYGRNGGDDYFIDAKDSIVAIVVGGTARDVVMMKSTDWGVTFTQYTCDAFPVGFYDGGSINLGNGANVDTLDTNDGNVTCLIDNFGKVHVWWGYYKMMGSTTAGSWSYFPLACSKLIYWSEYTNQAEVIDNLFTVLHDCDGNGTINTGINYNITGTNTQDAKYRGGLITQPQAGIDANGNIFVVYSSVMDNDTTGTNNSMGTPESQPYRDLFMMHLKKDPTSNSYDSAFAATSAGFTWSFPVNITKSPGFEDVFPSMARNVDNNAYITWQEDMEPGTNLTNGDPVSENYIKYLEVDINQLMTDATVSTNVCQTTVLTAPTPKFDTASNGCTWTFTDQSTNNPLTWAWTFGANANPLNSTNTNPVVTYSTGGNKTVQLSVANQAGVSIKKMTITVNASGCINGIENLSTDYTIGIYPNPTNGLVKIAISDLTVNNATISIENMLGQQVAKMENQNIVNGSVFNFDLTKQNAGVYFIKIQSAKGNITEKFVVQK